MLSTIERYAGMYSTFPYVNDVRVHAPYK